MKPIVSKDVESLARGFDKFLPTLSIDISFTNRRLPLTCGISDVTPLICLLYRPPLCKMWGQLHALPGLQSGHPYHNVAAYI